jgi:hypothetical protein
MFNKTSLFDHIPNKPYGRAILEDLILLGFHTFLLVAVGTSIDQARNRATVPLCNLQFVRTPFQPSL